MYIKQIKQQQNGTGNAFNNTHLLLFDSQICSHFMTGKSYANQPDCRVFAVNVKWLYTESDSDRPSLVNGESQRQIIPDLFTDFYDCLLFPFSTIH